ncbi:MAG: 16S rRNA (cytosine(1402)-N(4))-methyltransferase RsmH [candidate division Zixibacteria bacterium]|nr:16S rRNA (cytosine(1402)-N(4))-methyltransferase RsmH [candidate division Zixibacteria bacterium]
MMKRPDSESYHRPVMTAEVVGFLVTDVGGAYLDLTAGGGGFLRALAATLDKKARLYAVDKDPAAVEWVERTLAGFLQFKKIIRISFSEIDAAVEQFEDKVFDGILLDLGLSSRQVDDAARGFSFQSDGPLDMRFDPDSSTTAADLINTLNEKELGNILKTFGEERQAHRLAGAIVRERQKTMILTTRQLAEIVLKVIKPPHQKKSLARAFQALRIAVNRELDELAKVLPAATGYLKPGGRLVVLSYHSLEDRIVKNYFQQAARGCICPPAFPQCVCGQKPVLKILTRKPVYPGESEIEENARARSARLRAAEKI